MLFQSYSSDLMFRFSSSSNYGWANLNRFFRPPILLFSDLLSSNVADAGVLIIFLVRLWTVFSTSLLISTSDVEFIFNAPFKARMLAPHCSCICWAIAILTVSRRFFSNGSPSCFRNSDLFFLILFDLNPLAIFEIN